MWLILDLVIILVIALYAVSGAKKGLIKALCGIGVTIVSLIIAVNFHSPLAAYFRSTLIYEQLTENLSNKVETYVKDNTDSQSFSEFINDAPEGVDIILKGFGTSLEDLSAKMDAMIESGETNLAAGLSDYIVKPAAKMLSNALSIIVMFIASLIVLNLALLLLDLIFKLPVLNFANKFGGFIAGAAIGLLISFVVCAVINIALPVLPGIGIEIDSETVSKATVFTAISDINPLSFLYD